MELRVEGKKVYAVLARGGKYRVIRPTVDTMRREFQQLPKDAMKVTGL